eukprot:8134612-Pyramimonas_sp.AAC.1
MFHRLSLPYGSLLEASWRLRGAFTNSGLPTPFSESNYATPSGAGNRRMGCAGFMRRATRAIGITG